MTHPFDEAPKYCLLHNIPKRITKRQTPAGLIIGLVCPACAAGEPPAIPFRAANEIAFAAWLDALAVAWKYEALEERVSKAIMYQPDYWLPGPEAWLEIKPQNHILTPGEVRVARQLAEATARPVYVAAGYPYSGEWLQVWVFRPGQSEESYAQGKPALRWLMELLGVRLAEALGAARAVSVRHGEFMELWAEAKKGNNNA